MGYSVLTDNPLVWLRLAEPSGTACADASGDGNAGTISGATFTRGVASLLTWDAASRSISFTGASDGEIVVPHVAAFDIGAGDFTAECWIKTTASGLQVAMGSVGFGAAVSWWIGTQGTAKFALANSGIINSGITVNDGNPHHIALTRASGTLTIYVDGTARATTIDAETITTNTAIEIGNFLDGSGFQFNGTLSEPAFYSSALSATRIKSHYSAGAIGYERVDAILSTGQAAMLLIPTGYSGSAAAVMYHHGVGEDQTALLTDGLKTSCVNALAQAGFILCGTNAHGENWGNASAQSDYVALRAYVESHYMIDRWGFWCQSMGGCSSLLCLRRAEFADVQSWLGTYPITNLASMFAGNAGTFSAAIRTAYGIASDGSDYASKTAGFDPSLLVDSSYAGKSFRFYASDADTVVSKAQNTTQFSTALAGIASQAVVIDTSGDHGDPSNFVPADYVTFFQTIAGSGLTLVSGSIGTTGTHATLFFESDLPSTHIAGPPYTGITFTRNGVSEDYAVTTLVEGTQPMGARFYFDTPMFVGDVVTVTISGSNLQDVDSEIVQDVAGFAVENDSIITTMPASTSGNITRAVLPYQTGSFTLVRGDTRRNADGNPILIEKASGAQWPTDLDGWTIAATLKPTLKIQRDYPSGPASLSATGAVVVTATGDSQLVRFDLVNTDALIPGAAGYAYDVQASNGTSRATLETGVVTVIEDQTTG